MKFILCFFGFFLPWIIRRRYLNYVFGYRISQKAKIGFSLVIPKFLEMEDGSRIGHLNVAKGLDLIKLGQESSIGNLNWISGYPSGESKHFSHVQSRDPSLLLGGHSAITNRHLIDCTDRVEIGCFTTFAGFRSQILTHSIDLKVCLQGSKPVVIGNYCFVGTGTIVLGGAFLPDYCVLGAASLLIDCYKETHALYAGVPAKHIKNIPDSYKYFNRKRGFVD